MSQPGSSVDCVDSVATSPTPGRAEGAALEQITDSTLRCSVPGRIFGFGTVRIETAGQADFLGTMTYAPCPDSFYRVTLGHPSNG